MDQTRVRNRTTNTVCERIVLRRRHRNIDDVFNSQLVRFQWYYEKCEKRLFFYNFLLLAAVLTWILERAKCNFLKNRAAYSSFNDNNLKYIQSANYLEIFRVQLRFYDLPS